VIAGRLEMSRGCASDHFAWAFKNGAALHGWNVARTASRGPPRGEAPIGAALVLDGKIIASAGNRTIGDHDPTAHAEILAIRAAARALADERLTGCDLYVTLEPCAMCAGAITHARNRRLIYGAEDPKAGAVHSMLQVLNHPKLNHHVEVTSGVLAARCMDLVQTFFRQKRQAQPG